MMVGDFHFLRPEWFLLVPVLLGMILLLSRRSTGTESWKAVCEPHLLPHVLVGIGRIPSKIPWILLGMGWLLAVLALAGPTWSKQPQPVFRAQSGLVVVLDLSQSMDAEDVRPSRLTRAKHKVIDILKRREEGQTALVVFSQESFVVSPLTDDATTIAAMVPALSTDLMPVQGSRLDLALETSDQLLSQSGIPGGNIIVITDGGQEHETELVATHLHQIGRRVSVLGVGTANGAPIPVKSGGFLKDRSGAIVIPKFQGQSLATLAKLGGGQFVQLQNDDSDLEQLGVIDVDHTASKEANHSKRTTDLWNEEGPWLVLALMVLALPAFRRGWVGVVLLGMVFLPSPVKAWTWEDLWLRSDQQGARELQAGNPEGAANLFSDQDWKGVANYRAGDYEQAIEAFAKDGSSNGHFNRGNALARLGKLEDALAAYEKALTENPDHEDATFNAELIRELMKQQASQQQSQQGEEGQEGQEDENQPSASSKEGANEMAKEAGDSQSHPPSTADQRSPHQDRSGGERNEDESMGQVQEESDAETQAALNQRQSEETTSNTQPPDLEEQGGELSKKLEESASHLKPLPNNSSDSSSQMAQSQDLSQEEQESQQATIQWLRQIPDDPGGLLRRKFLLEHQRRQGTPQRTERPW